ncbi:MAG: four helix bundle protein [Candidatus Marinimicrobia bacterium]|nr:four helix bundle protein [Candidatus Neomarinimicrobiota bacterium]
MEIRNWKLGREKNMLLVYELDVYRLAEKLSNMIWYDFDKWNNKAQKTIGYQIIRSADSISANIAEGYGRYTSLDRKRFYLYSRGSLEETKSWLRKLAKRKILSDSRITEYKKIIDELGPKLNAFINSTKGKA